MLHFNSHHPTISLLLSVLLLNLNFKTFFTFHLQSKDLQTSKLYKKSGTCNCNASGSDSGWGLIIFFVFYSAPPEALSPVSLQCKLSKEKFKLKL